MQALQRAEGSSDLIRSPRSITLLVWLAGLGIAWGMAYAIVQGGTALALALALSGTCLLVPVFLAVGSRVQPGFISIEAPMLLLLFSHLVLRARQAEDLAANPLDAAGAYRVVCVGIALLLGALALTDRLPGAVRGRITTLSVRLYCVYVFIVFLGAPLSVNPLLTAYRGVELAVGVVVIAGAYRTAGAPALRRLQAVLYWWIVALIASAWLGVVVFGGEGLSRLSNSPFPWQLKGVLPSISSNGLGVLGAILAFWSLCLLVSRDEDLTLGRITLGALTALGLITLLFAQYRTGYVATVLALVVLVALRSRITLAWAFAAVLVVASIWGSFLLERVQPLALRGQSTDQAAELSSRFYYWQSALPVWEESPLLGRGLLTGTRFEVLAKAGLGGISTIHGTWIEALVGTGIIGTALLVLFITLIFGRALREAVRRHGRLAPAVLLTVTLVRSTTGSTFEIFGFFALLVLVLAFSLRNGGRAAVGASSRAKSVASSN